MNVFPEKFRFYFEKEGVKTQLKHAPEEWDTNVLKWSRDKDTEGILTEYVDKFTFVLEDADYLRDCFKKNKVFAKVKLSVYELNSNNFEYFLYYIGDLDFYSYTDDNYKIQLSALDIGFKTAFDANFDTEYEISVPEDTDKVLYNRLQLLNIIKGEALYSERLPPRSGLYGMDMLTDDEISNPVFDLNYTSAGRNIDDDSWFLQAKKPASVTLKLKYDFKITFNTAYGSASIDILLSIKNKENSFVNHIANFNVDNVNNKFEGTFEKEFDVKNGDKLFLTFNSNTTAAELLTKAIVDSKITFDINYISIGKDKIIPGVRPAYLLKELISKATDGKYGNIDSFFLESPLNLASNLLISSGNLIRGIKGAKITTSLKDFFKAIRVLTGAVYWFDTSGNEEKLIIRHVEDAFAGSEITRTDEISDYKQSIYSNYIYNQLQVGYKDNTYDEINGKYEFNTELSFAITTDAKAKKLELISPFRADMYGIEFLILDYETSDTTDSENDNDVFVFHTGVLKNSSQKIHELDRTLKDNKSLAGNTAFNLSLSPKHCLLRQIKYIASVFQFSGSNLNFASSEKDYNMLASDGVDEHADVNLNDYNKLFNPVQYEFETKTGSNMSELVRKNPNGYIIVKNNGKTIKGYIISVSENPGREKSQKWQILEKTDE